MISVAEPIDADALRIRHEFLTLPSLHTSVEECAHLLSVSPRQATHILESLVQAGFLRRLNDGRYERHPNRIGSEPAARPPS